MSVATKEDLLSPKFFVTNKLDICFQELEVEHREKKSHYDTTSAGLESNRSKLEQVCSFFLSSYFRHTYDNRQSTWRCSKITQKSHTL